jgi:glycosyltransferase involved in cell wall biosynthesis
MEQKLISVAIATFNGAQYLEEQLDSIYDQTYKNIEVIVCDDQSSDDTVDILKRYSDEKGLKFYVNETRLGFVKNFEKVISKCKGDYIALSDQDDIWLKQKLEILVSLIGDSLLIHSDSMLINAHNEIILSNWKGNIKSHTEVDDFFFSNVVTGCTILFSRNLINLALPFPKGLQYHDWWLSICAANSGKISYCNKSLVMYRQHGGQDTGAGEPKNKLFYIINNIYSRIANKSYERYLASEKHLLNLNALSSNYNLSKKKRKKLTDAMTYFENYLNNFFHPRTFFIGLKHRNNLYHKKNYFYLKNILKDIIG